MKTIISKIYFDNILKFPGRTLIALIIILSSSSIFISNFKLDASADSLILENDKDLMTYRETTKNYSTNDFVIFTFTPNKSDIFNSRSLDAIKDLKGTILELDGIESVVSIVDIPLVESSNLSFIEMIENVPNILSESVNLSRAKKEILNSPIYKNLIISEDGNTTAIQINLVTDSKLMELARYRSDLISKKINEDISKNEQKTLDEINAKYQISKKIYDERIHSILNELRRIKFEFESKYDADIKMGGIPMIADDMIGYVKSDLINFGIGVFIFILVTLIVIFRKLQWVILPIASCVYSVIFMIGILGFLDWKVTVISSNFISLMLILTLSMNIHLIVRYKQLSSQINDQYKLICQTTSQMVWPCLYTALTTIVAFASLVFSDIKPVIDFGYMMTIGLIVTFLTSFLLLPSLISFTSYETNKSTSGNNRFPLTNMLAQITLNKGRVVYLVSIVLLLTTIFGVAQLRVENSFINYFKSNTEIYQGMKQIDDKLGGTTPMDIIIKFKDNENLLNDDFEEDLLDDEETQDADWFTVDKINKIKKVHDYLDSLPEIGKVLSLASTVRVAEIVNDNKELDSLELALLYKRAPDEVRDIAVNPYVSIDKNEARINVRILDSKKDLRRNALIKKINNDLEKEVGLNNDEFYLTGILILYNNMLQSLFDSQIMSLGFVMLGITIMFLVLFQSILLAVIGIIPNLLAATFVLGLMGLLNLPLDMMTITIAAITIGIAVDNSIHYIYRFREEYINSKNYENALINSHDSIGRAIFFTGITIIFGFSILILSNFIPTILFGLFTGLAMLVALLAVLTLLPKLIISIRPFS